MTGLLTQVPALFLLSPEGSHLPFSLLLIFGVAKLLSELSERLGQPGIIGEIAAGIVLGPSLLNWVQPDHVFAALSEMGVLFLLFRVGLEVKSSELLRVGGTAFLVAVLGVAAPFALGWTLMALADVSQIEAIFVGTAMMATSVGITAQVLAAKGLLQERASKIILGAAVIDDVLGLLVLAFVSNLAEGHVNLWGLATTAVLACGFTLVVARFGTQAMRTVVPRLEQRLKASEAEFNLALILLFGLSLFAVYAGVAAIVGAFLAGMALSETVNHRVHDLASGVTELLVPFFLAGIGLHFDVSTFAHRETLILAGVITVGAVFSKLVACGVGALRLGRRDMLRVGVGMVPRGEVGMVVAQLGLSMNVIEKPVYAVVVFMAVATTVIAPPLLKIAYRGSQPHRPEEEFSIR